MSRGKVVPWFAAAAVLWGIFLMGGPSGTTAAAGAGGEFLSLPSPMVLSLAPGVFQPHKRAAPMEKYVCAVCDYVYDPALGDPDGGIPPGTAFEDLPDDWCCPECGMPKDLFEPEE